MYWNLQLTLNCNLNCNYCNAQETTSTFPKKVTYSVAMLKNFIEKDPDAVILFYGGEPLLETKLMLEIMDSINAKKFILQTNGLLLHKIPVSYLEKFDDILVSIDGNKEITDFNRGINTFNRVIENCKNIREKGFKNELIARMTVGEQSNIYRDVNFLLSLENPQFDSVHWQLDMMFNEQQNWKNLKGWIKIYNNDVKKLIEEWLERMKREGKVTKIYPFIAIMKSLILNKPTKLYCGCGWIWQNINTDGTISACPVCSEFGIFQFGHIENTHPLDTKNAMEVKKPCINCNYFRLCGGRCLFANYCKPWGEQGFDLVCNTIKNLIDNLKKIKLQVVELIKEGIIKIEQFNYSEFNGCEIIP